MFAEALSTAGTGAVFGAAMLKSGVAMPAVIIDQFELTDFRMLQVFAVAMGSGAAAMLVFEKLGIVDRPVKSNNSLGRFGTYDGNIVGGTMLGAGMALSGSCPGAVLVQLAQGYSPALYTAAGAVLGAGAYVSFGHLVKKQLRKGQTDSTAPPKKTISDVSRIPEVLLYPLMGTAIAGILHFTKAEANGVSTTPLTGGLLIGLAQAVSLLLTSSPLGVSTMYEQVSRYILRALGNESVTKPSWPPKSIIFSLGIVASSTVLARQGLPVDVGALIPLWQAFAGGFAMAFGSRLGGGCTSGHGLSGLGALSFSSLVTVASMFGAGIATRSVMKAIAG